MDYLEQPEIKETYNKCKLIVKVWEHKFTKKYKRLPSKLDIREASRDVRNAYRKYFQLKTAALEQSFRDIEGFEIDEDDYSQSFSMDLSQQSTAEQFDTPLKDSEIIINDVESPIPMSPKKENKSDINEIPKGVWGTHLNHEKKEDSEEKIVKKENPNLSITKKLFCGSKFTKRNPRKSLSFSHKTKSNISVDDNISSSQPITSITNGSHNVDISSSQPLLSFGSFTNFNLDQTISPNQNDNAFNKDSFKMQPGTMSVQTQPINVVQTVIENNYKTLRTVDTGWLQMVAQENGVIIDEIDLKSSFECPKPISFPRLSSASSLATESLSSSDLCKGTENTKLDYDSEDIIEESDDETCSKDYTSLHISKKRKIEPSLQTQTLTLDSVISNVQTNTDYSDKVVPIQNQVDTDNCMDVEDYEKIVARTKQTESVEEGIAVNQKETEDIVNVRIVDNEEKSQLQDSIHKEAIRESEICYDVIESKTSQTRGNAIRKVNNGQKKTKAKTPQEPRATPVKKTKTPTKSKATNNPDLTTRKSTRQTRAKASFQELSSGEEDPFSNDDDLDKDFEPNNKNQYGDFYSNDEEVAEIKTVNAPTKKTTTRQKRATSKTPRLRNAVVKKTVENKQRTPSRRKTAIKTSTNKDNVETNEDEEQKTYDLEFSVKPRIVAPRYTNIKQILAENKIKTKADTTKKVEEVKEAITEEGTQLVKSKRQLEKETFEKKIASGKLNDNFVRINIQKKVFARGKSFNKFSKYKKSQWKAAKAKALCGPDMDMGGCDGGMLVCFNCGQTGHFARNCKASKGDSLLPLTAQIEKDEVHLPTLEEAAKMAEGALKIRAPSLVNKKEQIQGSNGDSDLSGDEKTNGNGEDRIIDCSQDEDDNDDDTNQNDTEHGFDEEGLDSDLLLEEALKLEEHVRQLDVQQYLDRVKVVEPYYQPNEDGSIIATPPEVFEALSRFGHTYFRGGQEQAIMRILSGKSTLVTLSTGSGKSLCYQLPAYMYSKREPCISLIISPLVSLMDDQVTSIAKFMKAACLHSNQTKNQRQKILEMISNGELSVLLVSPEAVVAGERNMGFGSFLRKLPPIAFACIDEAHCVSQWSHNFRPSYLMICRVLRESLGVKTILGLTATATRTTRQSIIEHLCIPDGEAGVISDIPLPDNLMLTVSKDAERDYALLELLMSPRFAECKSIIVYCTRRDQCEKVATFLRTTLRSQEPVPSNGKKRKRAHFQAEPYHAGLPASRRRTIQNAFMSGNLRIVVATVAFGMGINKSDIRAVIHYNMPNSFESYVQEVGRAGRDGLKAHCHVFLDSKGKDENELRRHIHANSIERYTIRKLLQKVFVPCSCVGVCSKHEVAFSIESTVQSLDISEENISTLLCYLELHPNKYIQVLSPAYTWCKIISYGGPLQIKKVAKDCPPLAMALALHKRQAGEDPNILEFPVIEVASAMGWESGICKHKLKNLEWITVNNQPKRSPISVQLTNLGFRLLAPGNLSGEQLDEALDNLYNRVVDQERKALLQLNAVHVTLKKVAKPTLKACSVEEDDCMLKMRIREYFNSSDPLKDFTPEEPGDVNEEQLVNDIQDIINMYRDNNFTGRAIARIFQGIQSPNFPAVIWGRCKFWRSYLNADFHTIVRMATREIINSR